MTRSGSPLKTGGSHWRAYLSLEDLAGSIPAIDVPMEAWDAIIQDEFAERYAKTFT